MSSAARRPQSQKWIRSGISKSVCAEPSARSPSAAIAARSALSHEFVDFLERSVPLAIQSIYSLAGALVMLALYDRMLVPLCLLLVLPLVGWGTLSAGHYPIVLYRGVHLPPILPANPRLYWLLRQTHMVLAFLLFAVFLAHLSAILFHTLVLRDGMLHRMSLWPTSKEPRRSTPSTAPAAAMTGGN